jgi:hypothetical protein
VESALKLTGGEAVMAALVSPFWSRVREGKEMEEFGVSWRPLNASWADMWGRGRRTVATTRPRVDDGLRPVGHD